MSNLLKILEKTDRKLKKATKIQEKKNREIADLIEQHILTELRKLLPKELEIDRGSYEGNGQIVIGCEIYKIPSDLWQKYEALKGRIYNTEKLFRGLENEPEIKAYLDKFREKGIYISLTKFSAVE